MRLICGFLNRDGKPAETARLEAMMAAQIGDGLDPRRESFVEGPVALAQLDFAKPSGLGSLGRPESGLIVVGESGDTGLPDAVERQGPEGLSRLDGGFAIAAWSGRTRSLLLGRDAFGVRPLFLSLSQTRLVFASLPSGLFASGLISRELDEAFLLGEALLSFLGPERSLFRGVERLSPGGWLRVSAERAERGRHWALDPAMEGTRNPNPQAAAEEAAALVEDAVRRALPPAGPVAAHLSGGLDSASLAILAARQLRQAHRSLLAYSLVPGIRFRQHMPGELPGIEPVLRQEPDIGWTPIAIEDPARFVLPSMDPDQLMPIDPADAEVRICCDAARRGASVLLSGWGGDEGLSFNGRGMLAGDIAAGRWLLLGRRAAALHGEGIGSRVLLGEILSSLLGGHLVPLIGRIRGGPARRSVRDEILPCLSARAVAAAGIDLHRPAVKTRYGALTGLGLPRRTEHWAVTAARHGLAAAFPLLDRKIVEFAFSLSGNHFLRGSSRRLLFRRAMAGILPPEISQRPEKLDTLPEMPLLVASQQDTLRERLGALRAHPRAAALFDLDEIDRRVARLTETAEVDASALRRVFLALEFVAQHH